MNENYFCWYQDKTSSNFSTITVVRQFLLDSRGEHVNPKHLVSSKPLRPGTEMSFLMDRWHRLILGVISGKYAYKQPTHVGKYEHPCH